MCKNSSWRTIFYVAIGQFAISIISLFICYHPPTFEQLHHKYTKIELLKETDVVGSLLWMAGVLMFVLGISWGGGYFAWSSATVISLVVIGAVLFVLMFVWGKMHDSQRYAMYAAVLTLIQCDTRSSERRCSRLVLCYRSHVSS